MKKLLTLMLIVFFSAYVGNIYADTVPVQVLSSDFSIAGNIYGDSPVGEPSSYFSDSYNQSGYVPLSDSVSNGNGGHSTVAQSSAGFFSVSAYALASVNVSTNASAQAVADWKFQPLSPMDKLTIYYDFGFGASVGSSSGGNIVLTDTTDGTIIFSTSLSRPPLFSNVGWDGSDLINYSFQTNHVYELSFSTQAVTHYDPISLTISTNDIVAVPEPSTILLLASGLIGLVGLRRRMRS